MNAIKHLTRAALAIILVLAGTSHAAVTKVGAFAGTVIRPAALTGTVNDWAPTGLSTATSIIVATSGTTTLNGLTGGVEGRQIQLCNTGTFDLTLANEAAASAAANRFMLAGAANWILGLTGNSCAAFVYDGTALRWKMTSKTGTIMPSLTVAGAVTVGTTLNVTGATTVAQMIQTAFTEAINGAYNNFAINSTATIVRFTLGANSSITGFSGGVPGRRFTAFNASGGILLFTNESGSSSAANRLTLPEAASTTLRIGSSMDFYYDGVTSRWIGMLDTRIAQFTVDGTLVATTTLRSDGTSNLGDSQSDLTNVYGHYMSLGTAPVLTSCGGGATIVGNDQAGIVSIGTVATGCVITFATSYGANAPACVVTSGSGIVFSYTVAATVITVTAIGALSSTTLIYNCKGRS